MVRTLRAPFDNEDYARLERAKQASGLVWRSFLLRCCLEESEESQGK
jgi:hypothetical protein